MKWHTALPCGLDKLPTGRGRTGSVLFPRTILLAPVPKQISRWNVMLREHNFTNCFRQVQSAPVDVMAKNVDVLQVGNGQDNSRDDDTHETSTCHCLKKQNKNPSLVKEVTSLNDIQIRRRQILYPFQFNLIRRVKIRLN